MDDGDFMLTRRKKNSSHTWWAILAGYDMLRDGLIKSIGCGEAKSIWKDWWIVNHPLRNPITVPDGLEIERVSDFVTTSDQWNEELVRWIFCDFDTRAILSTLCNGHGDNF